MESVKEIIANLVEISPKPRDVGSTMVIEKGLSVQEAKGLAEAQGEFIDIVKLGWTTWTLTPAEVLKEKIAVYKEHNIKVCTGGTSMEVAYVLGKTDEFFEEVKSYGFDMVEVSNGSFDGISKTELIKKAIENGFNVCSEVGKKDPEEDHKMSLADRISEIKQDLDAGAKYVILEAREGGKNLGIFDENGNAKSSEIDPLIKEFGLAKLMVEAPNKNQQIWLLKRFGKDLNLGNISVNDVIPLATLRKGIRGDTIEMLKEWSKKYADMTGSSD